MKPPAIVEEFKNFISKGNVIDLAVGVVIGGAFSKLVEGVVNGLIMPIVAIVTGKGSLEILVNGVTSLAGGVGNFLLLAAVVFFVFVKPMNRFRELSAKSKPAPTPAPPSPEERAAGLLEEIRDLLKTNSAR